MGTKHETKSIFMKQNHIFKLLVTKMFQLRKIYILGLSFSSYKHSNICALQLSLILVFFSYIFGYTDFYLSLPLYKTGFINCCSYLKIIKI